MDTIPAPAPVTWTDLDAEQQGVARGSLVSGDQTTVLILVPSGFGPARASQVARYRLGGPIRFVSAASVTGGVYLTYEKDA